MSAQTNKNYLNTVKELPEKEVFEKRMILGDNLTNTRGTQKTCIENYHDFFRKVHQAQDSKGDESNENISAILVEVEACAVSLKRELFMNSIEMRKVKFMSKSADKQLLQYQKESTILNDSIENTKKEIEQLKETLKRERQVRRNLEEYEQMAKLASRFPSRKVTSHKLSTLKQKIDVVEEEKELINSQCDVRRKQFQVLLQSIFDLTTDLSEDEEQSKRDADAVSPDEKNNQGRKKRKIL